MEPSIRRFAAISDVHGNVWALEAVLRDIARRKVDCIVNLGDHLYGPLEPLRTLEILQSARMICIQGNCDRLLWQDSPVSGTMQRNRELLSGAAKSWLRGLPATRWLGDQIFLCHATPKEDDVTLLDDVQPGGVVPRVLSEVEEKCSGVNAGLILCGHSHQPGELRISGGRTVVNVGSVGLPAYTDELPFPHAMQSGSPHAKYVLLEHDGDSWSIERIEVEYEWELASETASRNGRQDWAECLLTGRADISALRLQ